MMEPALAFWANSLYTEAVQAICSDHRFLSSACCVFPNRHIYIPRNGVRDAVWADPAECVWHAPSGPDMVTKHSLSHVYSHAFPQLKGEMTQLKGFFSKTLGVHQKCTWETVVSEIRSTKTGNWNDMGIIANLYKYLHALNLTGISKTKLQ